MSLIKLYASFQSDRCVMDVLRMAQGPPGFVEQFDHRRWVGTNCRMDRYRGRRWVYRMVNIGETFRPQKVGRCELYDGQILGGWYEGLFASVKQFDHRRWVGEKKGILRSM